ncbi:MAG: hypothetical protein ACLFUS_03540 [Candidatus Sumerlaeia bacterium]
MTSQRMAHWGVLLDDGKALLIGGHGSGFTALDTCDLYDPATNSFSAMTMNYTHDGGALAKLSDGRYLIAGGAKDLGVAPGYATAEIFDPASMNFTATGSMNYARTNCRAATLSNGKVLIVGAWYNTDSASYGEIYDPATGTFSLTGQIPDGYERSWPVVLPTNDGKAYIFGGMGVYGADNPESVLLYDSSTNAFTVVRESLFEGATGWFTYWYAYSLPEAFTEGNLVYFPVFREDNSWAALAFDKTDGTITLLETSPALDGRYISAFILNDQSEAYLMQGHPTNPLQVHLCAVDRTSGDYVIPSEYYSLPANTYMSYANFTRLSDGRILVSGGTSGTGSQTNFSPTSNSWLLSPTETSLPARIAPSQDVEIVAPGNFTAGCWDYTANAWQTEITGNTSAYVEITFTKDIWYAIYVYDVDRGIWTEGAYLTKQSWY